ncbi:hypothetical protein XENOCAPTIV_021395 [Xenoophorus captivus]|uniref:Alpha-type protein kinase domain-containing protein n=1 Tax=Xenoophorus captivus TaxID=1517983 RepID=A0ABV0Q5R0_9TELE
MDDDLMFTMEEEGSAQRPSAQRNVKQRASSLSDANASEDDDDEENFISPILGDSAKEVCNYLKDLAYTRQLSNSLPQSNFLYRSAWINAIEKARAMPDPWAQFHLEEIETEPCIRYRYSAITGEWAQDQIYIKMAAQVDIMQMCVMEMTNRPGKPLFHLEHYIEGKYIKYNSNSGFVRDDNIRLTPQAFSHFTFERSGHQLIVVDIQGVGDLYTDPQIHTEKGTDFGDGNLGMFLLLNKQL